ncbi:MAG: class I SAM-dependent methyltransferase [Alphaproteobacteria bacterium]
MSDIQHDWFDMLSAAGNYRAWIMAQIAPILGGHVLEFGCGVGTLTADIARYADRLHAVDIDPRAVEAAKNRLAGQPNVQVECADATGFQAGAGYDAIVMLDVLEHIEDHAAMLSRVSALLRPGGRVVLKVPAHRFLYGEMDRAVGHHRRYSRQALRSVLAGAGLRPGRIWTFNAAAVPGWWWHGRVKRRNVAPAADVARFDRLVPLLRRVESVIPPPFGLSYFAVGTRDGG